MPQQPPNTTEIERKFLIKVQKDYVLSLGPIVSEIDQGYLIKPDSLWKEPNKVNRYPAVSLIKHQDITALVIPGETDNHVVHIPEADYKYLLKNCIFNNTVMQRPLEIDARTCAIRVRMEACDDETEATVCIKHRVNSLITREFEYPLNPLIAVEVLDQLKNFTRKTRYTVNVKGHAVQFDFYKEDNAPLARAEVEFKTDAEAKTYKFPWDSVEVTNDKRYSDKQLAQNPYLTWKDGE